MEIEVQAGCVQYQGGHCGTSNQGGGGGSPAKPARDAPRLSSEHWHLLKETLLCLNSSSSHFTTESRAVSSLL